MKNKYQHLYINKSGKFQTPWDGSVIEILPKDYKEKIISIIEKSKNNKLKNNSNVYLTPLSTLPSYKLKNYIDENKLNVTLTRKSNLVDTLIVNKSLITDYYLLDSDELWYIVPYNLIKDHYNSSIEPKGSGRCILENNNSWKQTDEYIPPTDGFIIKHSDIRNHSHLKELLNCPSVKGSIFSERHGNKVAQNSINLFTNLLNLIETKKLDLILDDTLNNEINKELTIDLETFTTLYNMLSSTDSSNYSIARELIANCEFETSKPYILFLANQFSEIRNKSNNKNYHNIHLQLKKYKKYYDNYENYAGFIEKTIKDYPEYKQILCDCLAIHLNKLFKSDLIKAIHSI